MPGAGIHVTTEITDIQVHHPRRMSTIDQRQDAFRARQRADFLHRQHAAVGVVHVAKRDQPGTRRDCALDGVQHLACIFRRMVLRVREVDNHGFDAVPGRTQVHWLGTAGVIVVCVDDLVTGFEVQPQRAEGHSLGGIVGDGNFVGFTANEIGELVAYGRPGIDRVDVFGVTDVVGVIRAGRVELRFDDVARRHTAGAGVHMGNVGLGQKLVGDPLPVTFILWGLAGTEYCFRCAESLCAESTERRQRRAATQLSDEAAS